MRGKGTIEVKWNIWDENWWNIIAKTDSMDEAKDIVASLEGNEEYFKNENAS
jgi:hypothetical protein